MSQRHFTRRPPTRNGGPSWARFPSDCGRYVTYRVFRRDHDRRLHLIDLRFFEVATRSEIAKTVRSAWHRLRDEVDELNLASERWRIDMYERAA